MANKLKPIADVLSTCFVIASSFSLSRMGIPCEAAAVISSLSTEYFGGMLQDYFNSTQERDSFIKQDLNEIIAKTIANRISILSSSIDFEAKNLEKLALVAEKKWKEIIQEYPISLSDLRKENTPQLIVMNNETLTVGDISLWNEVVETLCIKANITLENNLLHDTAKELHNNFYQDFRDELINNNQAYKGLQLNVYADLLDRSQKIQQALDKNHAELMGQMKNQQDTITQISDYTKSVMDWHRDSFDKWLEENRNYFNGKHQETIEHLLSIKKQLVEIKQQIINTEINLTELTNQQTALLSAKLERIEKLIDKSDKYTLSDQIKQNIADFFQKRDIPEAQWEETLEELWNKKEQTRENIQNIGSTIPQVVELREKAERALEFLDFDKTEIFIDQAIQMEAEFIKENVISLAKSFAVKAQVMNMQYRYREAAENYAQASKYLPDNEEYGEKKAYYLNECGRNYHRAGLYKLAEAPYLEAKKVCEDVYGEDHVNVATTLNNLSALYEAQGKYDLVEHRYLRALEIRENKLGKDHPDVAESLNNLAVLYRAQGKYDLAEPLYKRDLEITEKALGKDHPSVAATLDNLAQLYYSQGKYVEAESHYIRALEIKEKALGKDHPSVAATLNNLAGLYYAQGKYDLAEPHYLRALEIRENMLGKDHPHVAATLNNLAVLYKALSKFDLAEPRYLRALEIWENALGKDHPHVAATLNNLAGLYYAQGKYDLVEPHYLRALEIRENMLGKDHPSVATTLNNLAGLYYAQEKYKEAEPYFLRNIEILENAKMEIHPSLPTVYENYAIFLNTVGRNAEAREYEAKAAAAQAKLNALNQQGE